jgi:putative salt-induced outer membrane protein
LAFFFKEAFLFKILIPALFLSLSVQAQDTAKSPWMHESEVSVIQVSGNTESESYSAKQKTSYTFDKNIVSTTGRYIQAKAGAEETARSWDLGAKYERTLSDMWAVFAAHGAESDTFAGYVQRNNTDLGGKFYFVKSDAQNIFSEVSYRATQNTKVEGAKKPDGNENKGVVYVEWSQRLNETVSAKIWAKYQHNFTESKYYMLDYEPSLSVMMNNILSLKVAHQTKYQNEPGDGRKKEDRSLTTSLVAKF